jgi:hypothetical protein
MLGEDLTLDGGHVRPSQHSGPGERMPEHVGMDVFRYYPLRITWDLLASAMAEPSGGRRPINGATYVTFLRACRFALAHLRRCAAAILFLAFSRHLAPYPPDGFLGLRRRLASRFTHLSFQMRKWHRPGARFEFLLGALPLPLQLLKHFFQVQHEALLPGG